MPHIWSDYRWNLIILTVQFINVVLIMLMPSRAKLRQKDGNVVSWNLLILIFFFATHCNIFGYKNSAILLFKYGLRNLLSDI